MTNRATRIEPDTLDRLGSFVPTGRDPASVRKRIEAMEHLLEGLFKIPGTNYKIGLDVLLDLIPVGGDVIGSLMGAWMVWEARNLGMSKMQMARMFGNVGVDFLLGLIPVVGAVPGVWLGVIAGSDGGTGIVCIGVAPGAGGVVCA